MGSSKYFGAANYLHVERPDHETITKCSHLASNINTLTPATNKRLSIRHTTGLSKLSQAKTQDRRPHLAATQAGGVWRKERGERLEGLLRAVLLHKRHLKQLQQDIRSGQSGTRLLYYCCGANMGQPCGSPHKSVKYSMPKHQTHTLLLAERCSVQYYHVWPMLWLHSSYPWL